MVAPVSVATKFNVGGILLDRPFKIRRLGHFGFNMADLEKAHHFYSDLLGFRVSDEFARGGWFMRFGTDHHAFALFQKPPAQTGTTPAAGERRYARPDITINQITWQTQSLSEPVNAVDFLLERGVELQRTGRDGAGSNWATYFYDPDGHTNELYYGIEQVGWDGKSKPAEYRRPVREKVHLPVKSEFDEIQESLATTNVPIDAGYRPMELPGVHDVDGILLPRPFKIVKHGPVNLFVEDVARARDFYLQILGLQVTEEVTYRGEPCVFLRCNTEHHSLGLFPLTLREPLGLSIHTTCASFGIQVANYRQLREAVAFLRAEGVRVETDRVPPELHPGVDYAAWAFDPEGHCIQLYYYMEQVGWDGRTRPASQRRKVNPSRWPEVLEPMADTFMGEPLLGPWG
ncbi:MAG: extradiol dioxygenase [Chloroflexi bacterium]|nr:MAG: extradiol dioxygenase [Chloroflexota bacterium]